MARECQKDEGGVNSRLDGARTDTTQQTGQTANKEADFNRIAVTLKPIRLECCLPNTADCLAPTKWVIFEPTVWPDTCSSVLYIGFGCCYNGLNVSNRTF